MLIKTDKLVMEYFLLPYVDARTRFLYRFVTPVETGWKEGSIQLPVDMDLKPTNLDEAFKRFATTHFDQTLTNYMSREEWPSEKMWLFELKNVELQETKEVR